MLKIRKSSVYRSIERLMYWTLIVSNRVPNQRAFSHQIDRLNDEFLDALTACKFALNQDDLEKRLELINFIDYHLSTAASIISIWHLWSSNDGNNTKILSNKQLAFYLTETEKISRQLHKWQKYTKGLMCDNEDCHETEEPVV